MGLERPLPETDGCAAEYWSAAKEGRLVIQRCKACGGVQHYGRPFCTHCGGAQSDWIDACGRGMVLSFTEVHRSPYDDLPAPYVVALVRLEEGPTLLTHIVDTPAAAIRCDQLVQLEFRPLREGFQLPVFRLAGGRA
jgi:uncharacterized OB-fold protein